MRTAPTSVAHALRRAIARLAPFMHDSQIAMWSQVVSWSPPEQSSEELSDD
jgi:hypothetical protein